MAGRVSRNYRQKDYRVYFSLTLIVIVAGTVLIVSSGKTMANTNQPVSVVVAEYDLVKLPVPAEPVRAGTRFSDIKLKTLELPVSQVPAGALQDTALLQDAVTAVSLPANLPLFRENFASDSGGANPVIDRIPSGMRAMTLKVDATTAVEGWAGSGTIVDVLLVEKERTTVVAENVKVLSAERSVSPVQGGASPEVPSTVTLLVTQEQCLAINTAVPLGKIAFALRGVSDQNTWHERQYTADRLARNNSQNSVQESKVDGYIEVKGEGQSNKFTLADGKWIRTSIKPEGFLVNQE